MLSEPSAYQLPFAPSDAEVRLTPRLRETYLTAEAGEDRCVTQASGRVVHIWVWSKRENLRVDLPLDGFDVCRPYQQSIHRWGINVNRYVADDAGDGPSIIVSRDGEKPTVEATVETFDAEVMPDV